MDLLLPKLRTANPVEAARGVNQIVDHLNKVHGTELPPARTVLPTLQPYPVWSFWWKEANLLSIKGVLVVNGEYVNLDKEITVTAVPQGHKSYIYYDLLVDDLMQQDDNKYLMDIPLMEIDMTGDYIKAVQLVYDIVYVNTDLSMYRMKKSGETVQVAWDLWFQVHYQEGYELCNRAGVENIEVGDKLWVVFDVDPDVGLMCFEVTTTEPADSSMKYVQIGEACYGYSILDINPTFSTTAELSGHYHKVYGYSLSSCVGCHTHTMICLDMGWAGNHSHCAHACANQLWHYHALTGLSTCSFGCSTVPSHAHTLTGFTCYSYLQSGADLIVDVNEAACHKHTIVGHVDHTPNHRHTVCLGVCGYTTTCNGGTTIDVDGNVSIYAQLIPCDVSPNKKNKRGIAAWGANNTSKHVELLGIVRSIGSTAYFVPANRGVISVTAVRGIVGVGCIDFDTLPKYTP